MTVKQISNAVGKDVRSVQRWIQKASDKMSSINDKMSSSTSTHPAEYTMEETLFIIETGLGKNAAGVWRENATQSKPESSLTQRDIDIITHCVSATVGMVMERLEKKSNAITTHNQATQLLPPAPQLDTRSQITKVINNYAHHTGENHHTCWTLLYNEYNLRTHTNVRILAKNRGMAPIDYIDDSGQMITLLSIAQEMYGI